MSRATGNDDRQAVSIETHNLLRGDKSTWLFVADYSRAESNNLETEDNQFAHLRYVHKMGGGQGLEVFAQVQRNRFQKLAHACYLAPVTGGIGVRRLALGAYSALVFFASAKNWSRCPTKKMSGEVTYTRRLMCRWTSLGVQVLTFRRTFSPISKTLQIYVASLWRSSPFS